MSDTVSYKVCKNCGLSKREAKTEKINNESFKLYSYCLWRNKLAQDALLKSEITNGCKDFMEKIDGWTPEIHLEEKLKHFSVSNTQFANILSIIAIITAIIALIVSVIKK